MNPPRLLLPGENCADCAKTRRASMELLAPLRRVVLTIYDSLEESSPRCGDLMTPRIYYRTRGSGLRATLP